MLHRITIDWFPQRVRIDIDLKSGWDLWSAIKATYGDAATITEHQGVHADDITPEEVEKGWIICDTLRAQMKPTLFGH